MAQSKARHFLTGALVGAGLGILLAPKEGSETRKELKNSFKELIDTIKEIDVEQTKSVLFEKVESLKNELNKIDPEEAKEILFDKKELVEKKCDELITESKEQGATVVLKAAQKVKDKTSNLITEVLKDLDENEEQKEVKKQTSKKKKKKKKKTTGKEGK